MLWLQQESLQPGLQGLHDLAWEHLALLSTATLQRIAKQQLYVLGLHEEALSHRERATEVLLPPVPPVHGLLVSTAMSWSVPQPRKRSCTCLLNSELAEQVLQHKLCTEHGKALLQRDGVWHVQCSAGEDEGGTPVCPSVH